jgi:hypothetical protein
VTVKDPKNLRIMGEVVRHEYECIALFVENFGRLPEFNDKKEVSEEVRIAQFGRDIILQTTVPANP